MERATGLSLALCCGMLFLKIVYDITGTEWRLHSFPPSDRGDPWSSPTGVESPALSMGPGASCMPGTCPIAGPCYQADAFS